MIKLITVPLYALLGITWAVGGMLAAFNRADVAKVHVDIMEVGR